MSSLIDLAAWYGSNCDGEWEHEFGISIQTLDNPGWLVTIDLAETQLAGRGFVTIDKMESDTDWIKCWVESGKFQGAGDPSKLEAILLVFLEWVKSSQDWLKKPDPPFEEEEQQAEDEDF